MRNINRLGPSFNQFWRWSQPISIWYFRSILSWVLLRIPEAQKFTCFTKWKCHQNDENQDTLSKIESLLRMVRIHQHAKFNWGHSLYVSFCECPEYSNLIWPKSNHFSGWSGYINMPDSIETIFYIFPSANARNPQIWFVSLSVLPCMTIKCDRWHWD